MARNSLGLPILPSQRQTTHGTMLRTTSPTAFGHSAGSANARNTQQKPEPGASASAPRSRRRRLGIITNKSSAYLEPKMPANFSGRGTTPPSLFKCGSAVAVSAKLALPSVYGASTYACCAGAPPLEPSSYTGPCNHPSRLFHHHMSLPQHSPPLLQCVAIHSDTGASN